MPVATPGAATPCTSAAGGAYPLDKCIKGRSEDQSEAGDAEHAAEDSGPQRLPHFRSGPGCEHKRSDTEDEGERCHQDRPQSRPRGMNGGLRGGASSVLRLPRKLDDQDRVLGRQTHEHDEADLSQDVDVHAAQQQAADRGQQAHRHDQDHGERQRPAFVLRRKHEEDHHNGESEHDHGGVARLDLQVRQLGPLRRH